MPYQYTESNVPNLGHLKSAMQRAHGDISVLAALVVGTIEDMILQADISIATSAWTANADTATLAQGYAYKADVAVTGLIENANVNVTFSVPSLAVAAAAKLCPTEDIFGPDPQNDRPDGMVRFYAKTVPAAALTAKLDAIQLDEQADEEQGEEETE